MTLTTPTATIRPLCQGCERVGEQLLKSWKFWAGVALLVGLIILVESSFGWHSVLVSWQLIPAQSLLIAVLLMLVSYLLRALRFYDFFHQYCRGHFTLLTRITVLHNFFNNLLPMRSGETAFPLLMKQHFDLPYRHSAPALLWLRLLDLYALLVLAVVSLQSLLPLSEQTRWLISGALLAAPLIVLPLQNRVETFLNQHPAGWSDKVAELMHALPKSPWPFVRALFWTLINWALKLAVYAWLLQQFLPMPFNQSWIGATAGELSSVLPINGLAGAGTYEAGIVAGLIPWGLDKSQALAAAVNLHLFVLGSTFILTGLIALLTIRTAKNRPAHH
ncbi:lysylphosphatidylglycerol synthase transmembrane domain-containing protein [Bacterioplanoides sp.]|uniref:lysylphosphatidylglycerol synthase transmembrane domain-containing protein n=1 Tax=Bacterioplanoides sp. TaxID=2066072 RepID=UPI003B59991B